MTDEEKKRKQFCKSMGIAYTPQPTPPLTVERARKVCEREGCINQLDGDGHHGFCSPSCYHHSATPKQTRGRHVRTGRGHLK